MCHYHVIIWNIIEVHDIKDPIVFRPLARADAIKVSYSFVRVD